MSESFLKTGNMEHIINDLIKESKVDTNLISDGYHTFDELYNHRIVLFVVLCNFIYQMYGSGIKSAVGGTMVPWKSKKHHDGTSWDGWFIAGIGIDKGSQISYHLPLSMWDKLRVVTYDNAPEWDGHTSQDVLSRLLKLLESD